MRGRSGDNNKDFAQQMWTQQPNMPTQTPVVGMPQVGQQMIQQPVYQQPIAQQPIQPAQPMTAPAPPVATAPVPPAQPTTVADYTGLPPGGHYDQSTGQTIYVQTDGVRWQMMTDGSFNRL